MKLVECYYSNIPLLYETIRQCLINKDYRNESPDRIQEVLNHVQISFKLDNISILDRYLLSLYCGDKIIDISNRLNYTDIKNEFFSKNSKLMYQINDTGTIERNRSGINDNESDLPLLVHEYSSIISFQGKSILKLTGFMIQKFFIDNLKIDVMNSNIPEYLPDNIDGDSEYLEKALYKNFIQNFQEFKNEILNEKIQDLLCSMMLYTNYYSYNKKRTETTNCSICLLGINTPFGYIDFTSDADTVNIITNFIKDNLQKTDMSDTRSKIKIVFGIESSLFNFLEFNILTNSKFTIDHESFNTLLAKFINVRISNSISSQTTIASRPDLLFSIEKNEFFDVYDSKTDTLFDIERYELLPLQTKIKYNIEVSLQDINQIIHPILKKNISEKGLYLSIEQIAMNIYSLLYNN